MMQFKFQTFIIILILQIGSLNYSVNAQNTAYELTNSHWQVEVSGISGGITRISNKLDKTGMNWIHPKHQWGIFIINSPNDTLIFNKPVSIKYISKSKIIVNYKLRNLELKVTRELKADNTVDEMYIITNKGSKSLNFPIGNIDITVPYHDSYEGGAEVVLKANCNAHIWANGSSAYIKGIKMSGEEPNLGLILTNGSLAGYSLAGATFSNDRGRISINPETITLKPGQSYTLSWKLFWHNDWDSFWKQALKYPKFTKLEAEKYTFLSGDTIVIKGKSASKLDKAILRQNGKTLPIKVKGNSFSVKVKALNLGEQIFELEYSGRKERLITNVIKDPFDLIKARVNFIIDKQQHNEKGSKIDGAYLIYDNEIHKTFWSERNDYNEARERMGMGVLLAMYLPYCKEDFLRSKIINSLSKFKTFIAREIQDTTGVVYNASHYKNNHRIYNSPWVGHFQLAMFQATNEVHYLHLFAKTVKAYYNLNKGHNYGAYPIGLQVLNGLKALEKAGLKKEYKDVYDAFYKHASRIAEIGKNYPKSEVAYEQSIVAPGLQICLEMYLVTKESKFLKAVKEQMSLLEAFNGQQPDYRLNDLAIRHWDDYWFGKYRAYGDTFPHYWQTITAIVFDEYTESGADNSYRERAKNIMMNNLCLFSADGSASCAYLYPLKSMGVTGQRFDPWANDQDWALVNLLTVLDSQY